MTAWFNRWHQKRKSTGTRRRRRSRHNQSGQVAFVLVVYKLRRIVLEPGCAFPHPDMVAPIGLLHINRNNHSWLSASEAASAKDRFAGSRIGMNRQTHSKRRHDLIPPEIQVILLVA
jgi:hypothetical protein